MAIGTNATDVSPVCGQSAGSLDYLGYKSQFPWMADTSFAFEVMHYYNVVLSFNTKMAWAVELPSTVDSKD